MKVSKTILVCGLINFSIAAMNIACLFSPQTKESCIGHLVVAAINVGIILWMAVSSARMFERIEDTRTESDLLMLDSLIQLQARLVDLKEKHDEMVNTNPV